MKKKLIVSLIILASVFAILASTVMATEATDPAGIPVPISLDEDNMRQVVDGIVLDQKNVNDKTVYNLNESVELKDEIVPDKWYSDSKLYNKNYHNGKTFLVLNSYEYENYSGIYIEKYGKPDDVLVSGVNYIYVYNKNPFKKILD